MMKSFELLRHVVDCAERVVSKEELVQAVWPDVIVGDDSLAHHRPSAPMTIPGKYLR